MAKKKPLKPEELNGDHFNTPGGVLIYELVFELGSRLGTLEGMVKIVLVLIPVIFAMMGVLLAKEFGAF